MVTNCNRNVSQLASIMLVFVIHYRSSAYKNLFNNSILLCRIIRAHINIANLKYLSCICWWPFDLNSSKVPTGTDLFESSTITPSNISPYVLCLKLPEWNCFNVKYSFDSGGRLVMDYYSSGRKKNDLDICVYDDTAVFSYQVQVPANHHFASCISCEGFCRLYLGPLKNP
jgi:hypothetical protein